ncbi:hypothetical protein [uncultured Rhodoblastus sp.]|uniref:hypothetical protein n=1 Tax=uncultured Rhodoblastus sp. TaxID=543037 RepID=UPI0025D466A0|nr:hypothetical protein [uncultured Rhodoblastus sp.]
MRIVRTSRSIAVFSQAALPINAANADPLPEQLPEPQAVFDPICVSKESIDDTALFQSIAAKRISARPVQRPRWAQNENMRASKIVLGATGLERAAHIANHASTRRTQLYDRRAEEFSLEDVELVLI